MPDASINLFHRTTFAPVITKFTEAIKGVETIRTLGNEEPCTKRIFKRLEIELMNVIEKLKKFLKLNQ